MNVGGLIVWLTKTLSLTRIIHLADRPKFGLSHLEQLYQIVVFVKDFLYVVAVDLRMKIFFLPH